MSIVRVATTKTVSKRVNLAALAQQILDRNIQIGAEYQNRYEEIQRNKLLRMLQRYLKGSRLTQLKITDYESKKDKDREFTTWYLHNKVSALIAFKNIQRLFKGQGIMTELKVEKSEGGGRRLELKIIGAE